jgi:uncharacterized membrane protein YcaP (DUF421 family)
MEGSNMLGGIALKLVTSFFILWAITLFMGKKEISQLTPLDFFTSLVLSELVGEAIYDDQLKLYHLLFTLGIWTLLTLLFEKITIRFVKLGYVAEGKASLLIDDGKINLKLMKKNNVDFKQLISMLREQDIFSIHEVRYAVMESNGALSVMKKPEYESVKVKDLNLNPNGAPLTITVIENGVFLQEALKGKPVDRQIIMELARKQGVEDLKEIAYGEYDVGGELRLIRLTPQKRLR